MTTTIKVPYDGFNYLPHQEAGIRWMIEREQDDAEWCCGGILGDDMGLGKTWQTIGLLVNSPVPMTLIVAPPVLIRQWSVALEKSQIHSCTLLKGKWVGPVKASAPVFLCSYGSLTTNSAMLSLRMWDRIILDEGQCIRNGPKTSRFRAIEQLTASKRWILSGTPVQNKASDFKHLAMWLQCPTHMLKPSKLKELASNIILRRSITLLSDVMPEPPKHIAHKLEFTCEEEKKKFLVLVGNVEDAIEKNFNAMQILEKYLRLQQFIAHPTIYTDAMKRKFNMEYKSDDWTHGCTKAAKFSEIIEDTTEPTLVFCNFKQEMDILSERAKEKGYDVHFIRGGLNEAFRTKEIEATISSVASGKPTILFCQINAGNCGLNLQHLTRVIFYTQHWNPSVIDQALARSYRYGQHNMVTVHHIVLGSDEMLNIDRLMLMKHRVKRLIAKKLLPSLEFAYHPDITIGTMNIDTSDAESDVAA